VSVNTTSARPAVGEAANQPALGEHRPAALSADIVADIAAPRNDTERAVAIVWQELFGIGRMGIHDNFIEANGHSLLAIQIVARISKDLGVKLPVNALFEMPTIAEIAAEVDRIRLRNADEDAKLAEMLAMVEGLSDDEVSRLLNEKMGE
jgi:acyl carrier protein